MKKVYQYAISSWRTDSMLEIETDLDRMGSAGWRVVHMDIRSSYEKKEIIALLEQEREVESIDNNE